MWFKNLQLYRFTQPVALDQQQLSESLAEKAFTPCESHQPQSSGWVSPLGSAATDLIHAANGYILVCQKREERLLPASVVNDELAEKRQEIEEKQDRKVSRKEQKDLKEEIIFSLLPRAFCRSSLQLAYFAPAANLLVVNSASAKRADDLTAGLREAMGSLPVEPLTTALETTRLLTQWLIDGSGTHGFMPGSECELRSDQDASRTIKCKNLDLGTAEILGHIHSGMHVSKLELVWNDRLEFIIDENLVVKRLRLTDVFEDEWSERADTDTDDELARFDADFTLMTLEHASLLESFAAAFAIETDVGDANTGTAAMSASTRDTATAATPDNAETVEA